MEPHCLGKASDPGRTSGGSPFDAHVVLLDTTIRLTEYSAMLCPESRVRYMSGRKSTYRAVLISQATSLPVGWVFLSNEVERSSPDAAVRAIR